MLTKDLLRVSRAGGGYHPQFADREHRSLAARTIGIYQGHVGESVGDLQAALTDLEREAEDFKLVRGFGKLLEREATVETRAPIDPKRARRAAFAAAEDVGVVAENERERALAAAAKRIAGEATPAEVERSLYADLEERQVVADVDARWTPAELLDQYNLSLAQTALFDATAVRVRSSDPKTLVSAVKRLGLLYEIQKTPEGRVVEVTGPTSLFRRTRRYGTRFARLLRTVAKAESWRLEATIDDGGTERTLELSEDDPVRVPGTEPVADVTFDSSVEADFAARFAALDLDWELRREPEPLETGTRVMIPDFAFEYRHDGRATEPGANAADGATDPEDTPFRVYFEIMGFWTPAYVEKKLAQLSDLEDVELLVAVDESLGVGEAIETRDHRAITYSGTVRVKDVRDALRRYERRLVEAQTAALPDELRPEEDVLALSALADRRGVSEDALETATFPEHERVGRTLIRPPVLDALQAAIDPGMDLEAADAVLDDHGIDDTSAVLSRLGYRVEWDGLAGGTVRRK